MTSAGSWGNGAPNNTATPQYLTKWPGQSGAVSGLCARQTGAGRYLTPTMRSTCPLISPLGTSLL